jgi:hypothetical protein
VVSSCAQQRLAKSHCLSAPDGTASKQKCGWLAHSLSLTNQAAAPPAEPCSELQASAWHAMHAVQVRKVPPSDAKIFTEYILPCLSLLPTEAELSVQVRAGLPWRLLREACWP